ncbi:hypothetical protein Rleg4DRAFT_6960 [Rhizobium leguminosarum bv. trifolii WSM2297]|uniref:Uncharacterized protein n=1 Tax=Rhizobium leguminosarum bv. trifolii WSM2297 TaxID=754762 RepID=J0CML0_RHILT|nr:hypothetical protein Rleg4DRAFT_5061 [Rhizobium leguminosarum bv. trifolii WSM2297]EJC85097.1 hypothetical protein Rleg4DRAFT_6960 [Rhizobium leguminosarum bv. trifolii WSM2297]
MRLEHALVALEANSLDGAPGKGAYNQCQLIGPDVLLTKLSMGLANTSIAARGQRTCNPPERN